MRSGSWGSGINGWEGNDRWTEHIARAVAAHLFEELRRTVRGRELPEENQEYEWATRREVPVLLGRAPYLDYVARLGLFWEVYDVPKEETLSFELTLEREAGGLVERLTGFFPGGSQEGRGRVAWTEPAVGETHPRGITLNLSDLRTGEYILVLTVQWPGQPPLERRRALRVG
jgi:hypothetical protein